METINFQALMASSPVAILLVNQHGKIVFSNESCQRLLCFEKHELEALEATQALATLNHDDIKSMLLDVLSSTEKIARTHRYHCVNRFGVGFNCKLTVQSAFFDGQQLAALYFETDFSLQVQKTAFARINAQIENLIKEAPLPIVTANRNGEVTTWNPACEKVFGWKREEVIGHRTPWVPSDKLGEADYIYKKVTSGEAVVDYRTTRSTKDGRVIDVSIWTFPLYDSEGELSNVGGVIFDLTEQTRLERFLRKAKEDAELASTAKNVFLATISHEIRTPLAAILGTAELMRVNQENLESHLDVIQRNGSHLLSLIDDVLDLTKIEAQQLTVAKSVFSPVDELESAVAAVKTKAEHKKLYLNVRCAPDIPKVFFSDATRFRQVIINLLNNAIKFTRKGGVEVYLAKDKKDGKDYLAITVQDTGSGISDAEKEHIFTLFSQGKKASKRSDGAGVGLTLSRKIALSLGGDLSLVRTDVGKGSVFCFTLPVDESMLNGQLTSITKKQALDLSKKPLDGLSILVVDDCEDLSDITSALLRSAGARTVAASSGREAISQAEKGFFDLILMDIEMPDMNGFETTAYLRSHGYKERIAALTAHALLEERQSCLDAGCDTYISKPINFARLVETISQLTQSH